MTVTPLYFTLSLANQVKNTKKNVYSHLRSKCKFYFVFSGFTVIFSLFFVVEELKLT